MLSEEAKLLNLASRALDGGAIIHSPTRLAWDIAGKCQRPVYREATYMARPSAMKVYQEGVRARTDETPSRRLELDTRCRKCPPCLKARAAYWRLRAESEVGQSMGRTWFVTLTLSPESHFKMLMRAVTRLRERAEDFDRLEADRQFAERHRQINREITLWLKRVRKQSGVPLRYFLVAEAHKSGLPHYHALVHEVGSDTPVRASILREQWKLGFSQAKLVAQGDERKSTSYVAKYLAKSAIARVRASQGYGHISPTQPGGLQRPTVIETPRCFVKSPPDPTRATTERVSGATETAQ